ncbi:hypothetical protein, partial [Escherichia coli]|uniref:hypothetical protein n=1 Tax=Escherichia coli TaxID=562 RepID=UPI001AA159B8
QKLSTGIVNSPVLPLHKALLVKASDQFFKHVSRNTRSFSNKQKGYSRKHKKVQFQNNYYSSLSDSNSSVSDK